MVIRWLEPDPKIKPPEPSHQPPGLSFAEMKRQIGKKSPEMRKQVFTPKNHRTNPYK